MWRTYVKEEQSFKTYVDVVSAAQVQTAFHLRGVARALAFSVHYFVSYFPAGIFQHSNGPGTLDRPGFRWPRNPRLADSSREHKQSQASSQAPHSPAHAHTRASTQFRAARGWVSGDGLGLGGNGAVDMFEGPKQRARRPPRHATYWRWWGKLAQMGKGTAFWLCMFLLIAQCSQ